MRGDFSRDTFRPARHYSAVRLQQGRVVTDADWNEQADITRRRAEREAADVIGRCGAPQDAAGFAVVAATQALGVFALASDAWVVGEDGVIVSTLDAGATWMVHDSGTTAPLRAVHFATTATGWAVGDAGTILKTADGGTSWTPQPAGTTVALRSVFALDATRAWAVGDGGTLLRTTDGGATWTAATVGSGRLYAVRFADAARGWLVGQGGQIASTADGGATWTARDGGTRAHFRALHFASALTGWAAGDAGTIVKTTDGGVTWTSQSTPVASRLRSIAFTGSSLGWAAGDDGVALRTSDGGATWSRVEVGTRATLRGVALASDVLGWIAGDDSVAVRVSSQPLGATLQSLPGASLSLGPGRLYVDGILCELEARASFYAQPDRRVGDRLPAGVHLLYIDVWPRHVSHLEDPAIREVALGGPDTAARSQTVWQVGALAVGGASPPPNCLSDFADLTALMEPPAARLRARAEPAQIPTTVCEIGASAGFRRLENQLYRVEVHAGAPAAFKWSRENGSVAYAIVSIVADPVKNETVVTLAARGLDDNLDLGIGDWVEVVDDDVALGPGAGPLFEYLREGDDPREIVLQGVVPATVGRDPERHPLLRRWEQKPASGAPGTLPIEEDKWIDLEEGVQVWFAPGGTYRPGDYWLVPARTITGDVEWPRDEHGEPLARRPDGVEHHYCRLALVEADVLGTIAVLSDCRELFPPLTALTQLLYVSGDGQDGVPGVELPQPLRVRVARGSHPVAGARVRFSVEAGAGHLIGAPPGASLDVATGTDGVAACRWVLDSDPAPAKSYQRARAALLDAADQDVEGQAVVFCATGSLALQYVGGDGQEGTAAQVLAYPLQVRVSNGQRPVTGARIRFTVTGGGSVIDGGGGVVGANPVLTDADGLVAVSWRLGAALPQRVDAELLDAADNPIQGVAFSAAFRPQVTAAPVGCCITVGKGGDVPQLDAERLKKLLEEHKGRVCLCLIGDEDHVIGDLDGGGEGRVSLRGCGPASRIRLEKQAVLKGFAAFELAHVSVAADQDCGFAFQECGDVRVASVLADAVTSPERPVLRFTRIAQAVTVSDSRIRTKTGLGVVFDDAAPTVRLSDSEIEGVLSFYGLPPAPPPANPFTPDFIKSLAAHMPQVTFQPLSGRLFLHDCNVRSLTIGKPMLDRLFQIAAAPPTAPVTLPQTFFAATVAGNVILEPRSVFVSRTLTLTSCSFMSTPAPGLGAAEDVHGLFVAEHATAVGNLATTPLEPVPVGPGLIMPPPLVVITKPTRMRLDTANLVFMQH